MVRPSATKLLRILLPVLAVVGYLGYREVVTQDSPPDKFQGGIVDPQKYSSPKPSLSSSTQAGTRGKETSTAGTGSLRITVKDQNGRGVGDLPVAITGQIVRTITTDRLGRFTLNGPAGYYHFEVAPGCLMDR
ncbi:MAG TPA: carboxypeptidase-like regulatory domain-containing protein, partial [Actinomycetota bacterium]|nr:carboxypeptidase-like regulatory domain-containing protein [Actinomycetota bacterium]